MNTTKANIGDKVTVVENTTYHGFEIGSVVECIELRDWEGGHRFTDGDEDWWVQPREYTINPTPETGTLAELDVKPGDVVECVTSGVGWWTEGRAYVVTKDGTPQDDDGKSYGWSNNPQPAVTFRIISHAKSLEDIAHKSPPCGWQDATTPQRYVVVTDTETVLATRAEAEDLVTSGGVLAVYKLGDEVGMTATVTLD